MFNFKNKLQSAGASFATVLIIGLGVLSSPVKVSADDTEIFFGESKTANMLMILDESGSMDTKDDGAANDQVIVADWYQEKDEDYSSVRARTLDPLIPDQGNKARYATLEYYRYGSWRPYTHFVFGDAREVDDDRKYRWTYIDDRMTRLKEAMHEFLTSPETKDENQIGLMTYTTGRPGNAQRVQLIAETKRLDAIVNGKTQRQVLLDAVRNMQPTGNTPTAEVYYEAGNYIAGTFTQDGKNFKSPLVVDNPEELNCGYNTSVVLLTDGVPNSFNGDDDIKDEDIEAITGNDCSSRDAGQDCTIELSEHYSSNDVNSTVAGSTIQTTTVAFALDNEGAKEFLKKTASFDKDGERLAFTPSDTAGLAAAFATSLKSAQDSTSFVAPSIPLSQSNRLQHSNNLYMGMFKPSETETWLGNFKKYELEKGLIVDKNGALAVEPTTGSFRADATSFWTNVADGNDIEKGGALPKIDISDSADIYTNLSSNSLDKITPAFIDNYISSTTNDFQDRLFGSNATPNSQDLSIEKLKEYYTWVRDRTIDGTTDRRFGDVLHSKPEILEYDKDNTTAFVTTNQGYIHAIDTDTGFERWAFFPRQLFKNVPTWLANPGYNYQEDTRTYGLDGQMFLHTFLDSDDNKKHYLYVGMRRGGNYTFVLDVTDIENPQMLFTVGDEFEFTKSELSYETEKRTVIPNLGQSWSKPVVVNMHTDGDPALEKRLVLSGGYDTYYDNRAQLVNPASDQIKGDGIYSIPFDGSSIDSSYDVLADESDIDNSIVGDLTFIDINNDGTLDSLYAADLGGKIYRVDFEENSTNSTVKVVANVLATIPNPNGPYRFFNKPDVTFAIYDGTRIAAVGIGSGDRTNPKSTVTQDRYYVFYDTDIAKEVSKRDNDTIGLGELYDVTNTITPEPPATTDARFPTVADILNSDTKNRGWYFDLQLGEKVLSATSTIDFVSFFTTFNPAGEACGVTSGVNRLYAVNVLDGSPVVDKFKVGTVEDMPDRYTNVKYVGIAPPVTILFPSDTDIATLVGTQTICTGDDCDFFKPNVRTVKWKQKE